MQASQANSLETTRQTLLQIRRGADLAGLISTCPPLSTERQGFAFTHPARDIPAPHKTWDNPPLVSSEPTADHALGAPNALAAGRPAADEKRTA
jgi:hypothetical protein